MHILLWNAAPTHTPCSKHRRPLALSRTRKGLCARSPCRVRHGHSGPTTSQTPRYYRYLWRGKMLGEVCVCALGCSVLSDSLATPWSAARQAPLSMGVSRQEHWSRLPFPPPGDLPDPGIEPASDCVSCIGRQILYWHVLIRRLTTWTLYVWS